MYINHGFDSSYFCQVFLIENLLFVSIWYLTVTNHFNSSTIVANPPALGRSEPILAVPVSTTSCHLRHVGTVGPCWKSTV